MKSSNTWETVTDQVGEWTSKQCWQVPGSKGCSIAIPWDRLWRLIRSLNWGSPWQADTEGNWYLRQFVSPYTKRFQGSTFCLNSVEDLLPHHQPSSTNPMQIVELQVKENQHQMEINLIHFEYGILTWICWYLNQSDLLVNSQRHFFPSILCWIMKNELLICVLKLEMYISQSV